MGSGHFLVETVDYITDKALDFLNSFPWNPVTAHLEMVRATILNEMDEQRITIDHRRLTDVNLLKRHVLKRCIYGVDLNPMAVELAKVSLWLHCFTLGAPLSFLDHHFRCGNSLIGTTISEVDAVREAFGRQLSLSASSEMQHVKQAVGGMLTVGGLPDVTPAQVGESRTTYASALGDLLPFKRILNVHDLRHSAASLLLAQGVSPKMIADLLGHSRIGITMDLYSHILPAMRRDTADAMDQILGKRV
jgi:hypothetical protein